MNILRIFVFFTCAFATPMKRKRETDDQNIDGDDGNAIFDDSRLNALIDAANQLEAQSHPPPADADFSFPVMPLLENSPERITANVDEAPMAQQTQPVLGSPAPRPHPHALLEHFAPEAMRIGNAYDLMKSAGSDFGLAGPVNPAYRMEANEVSLIHYKNKLGEITATLFGQNPLTGFLTLANEMKNFLVMVKDYYSRYDSLGMLSAFTRQRLALSLITGVKPLPPNTPSHTIPLIVELVIFNTICLYSYQRGPDNIWFAVIPPEFFGRLMSFVREFDSGLPESAVINYLEIVLKLPFARSLVGSIPPKTLISGIPMLCTGSSREKIRRILLSNLWPEYYRNLAGFLSRMNYKRIVPVYSYSEAAAQL